MNGFSDTQIVAMLGQHSFWSRRACREVLKRPADFIPLFFDVLDSAIKAADDCAGNLLPACFFLAQMREKRAYPRLAALISFDEETVDSIWGDFIHETVPTLLRDTFDGDHTLLPRIMEDKSLSVWSRSAAFNAWGLHYLDGHISREEITGYFRHLLEEAPQKSTEDDRLFYGFLAALISDHQLTELIDAVSAVYDRNGIDRTIQGGREKYIQDFSNPMHVPRDRHIDDTIKELENWQWFEADKKYDDDDFDDDDFDDEW